jgi:hypothetical protein
VQDRLLQPYAGREKKVLGFVWRRKADVVTGGWLLRHKLLGLYLSTS